MSKDEERDQFPELAGAHLPRGLVELAGKVETAKKLAPTRPHPAAPNSQGSRRLWGRASACSTSSDKLTGAHGQLTSPAAAAGGTGRRPAGRYDVLPPPRQRDAGRDGR